VSETEGEGGGVVFAGEKMFGEAIEGAFAAGGALT
jgi:hypothetical protein